MRMFLHVTLTEAQAAVLAEANDIVTEIGLPAQEPLRVSSDLEAARYSCSITTATLDLGASATAVAIVNSYLRLALRSGGPARTTEQWLIEALVKQAEATLKAKVKAALGPLT